MGSKHIYNLGPVYCDHCHDTCLHRLTTDRPFFGVGPYSVYNIWMDAIKISTVTCLNCGTESKFNNEFKDIFKKLKDANLINLEDEEALKKRFIKLIELNDLLNNYSEEKKKNIIDTIYADYQQYELPYKFFEDYFLILFGSSLRKKAVSDYLYK